MFSYRIFTGDIAAHEINDVNTVDVIQKQTFNLLEKNFPNIPIGNLRF